MIWALATRRGETVVYEVTAQSGPPHDRTFSVAARVGEAVVSHGSGRSKKLAEQDAARAALEAPEAEDAATPPPEQSG